LLDSLLQEMSRVKLLLKVCLTICLLSTQVSAWYNTSKLDECDLAKKWDVTLTTSQIKLGPDVPSAPFSEGEYYSIEERNVTLECLLPKVPELSYIAFTFNSSYVEDMKTAVVRRRQVCVTDEGRIKECEEGRKEGKKVKTSESEEKIEACTVALFDGDTLDRIDPVPAHLPPACSTQRMASLMSSAEVSLSSSTPHLTLSMSRVQLDMTGTYQCSVLRRCNPPINQKQLEQEPVSVSKSLFLKVYPFPDYRSDMVVASTTLAIAAVVVLVTALVSSRSEDPVDHL